MSQQLLDEIRAQSEKIAKDCDRASIRDSILSANWYRWNLRLGVGSALLTALVASVTGGAYKGLLPDHLAAESWVQLGLTMMASLSALLTTIVTFLAPAEKANIYHEHSNRYWAMRDRIRKFARIECLSTGDVDRLKSQYETLLDSRIELDLKHPIVPEWVYDAAGERLRAKINRNNVPDEAPAEPNSPQFNDASRQTPAQGQDESLRSPQLVRNLVADPDDSARDSGRQSR
jgi:hypothetical protein